MLEFLVISLLQSIAGAPDSPPAPAAAEPAGVTAPADTAAPETAPEAPAPAAEPAAPAPVQMRRERVCHEMEISGRRIPQRVCRTVMVPVEPEQPQQ